MRIIVRPIAIPPLIGKRGQGGEGERLRDNTMKLRNNLKFTLLAAIALLIATTALAAPERVLGLLHVVPNKLRYRPLEAGTVAVTVHNFTATEQTATLSLQLVQELARELKLPPVEITVAAGADKTVELPFTTEQTRYGCEARVTLRQGDTVLDTQHDFFAVHENVWPVAIGAELNIASSSGYPWQDIQQDLKKARANYFNWWEKSYWAPDDWGDLTPQAEQWRSGEGGRLEIKAIIKQFNALAKANGIASITYGKSTSGGPAGWELARRHPDWFIQNSCGQPGGATYNTAYFPLARWNSMPGNPGGLNQWFYLYPRMTSLAAVDWGIDQLLLSAQEYGWDGVRFDGDFTWSSGNEEGAARNQRRMKERIWAKLPDYVFGYNEGYGPPMSDPATWDHGSRESFAGGAHWMNEGVSFQGAGKWASSSGGLYSTYEEFWRKVNQETDILRKTGATYHFIYGGKDDIRGSYKFLLGTQAGIHPVYGTSATAAICPNWGRFLTRWSAFFWDINLRNRPETDAEIGSAVPLWHAVKERVVDEKTKNTIVHLIVPPTLTEIAAAGVQVGSPAQQVTVRVRIPAGEKVLRTAVIATEHPENALEITSTRDGEWVKAVVPEVKGWSMVVFEHAGSFTLPAYPKFTEPPNAEKVREAAANDTGKISNDPLKPGAATENSDKRIVSVYHTYGVQPEDREKDPEALDGLCFRGNSKGWGLSHVGFQDLTQGRYRITARMKLTADKDSAGNSVVGHGDFYIPLRGTSYVDLRGVDYMLKHWKASDFTTAGKWENISGEFDFLGDSNYISTILNGSAMNGVVCVDTITLEKIKSYSDTEVVNILGDLVKEAESHGGQLKNKPHLAAAADFELHKQGAGLNVLVVNGLYNDLYRLPETLKQFGEVIEATPKLTEEVKLPTAPKGEAEPQEKPAPATTNTKVVHVTNVTVEVTEKKSTLSGYPSSLTDLSQFDAVIFINTDASWLSLQQRIELRDYVKAGGGLLVLGGNYTLGQGHFAGTFLEDVLPVTVAGAKDTQPAEKPLLLSKPADSLANALPAALWKEPVYLYWRHLVKAKPGARVELLAGSEPVLFTNTYGKGRVAVFTGTVLGNPAAQQQPFWQWNGWPLVMKSTIGWLTNDMRK